MGYNFTWVQGRRLETITSLLNGAVYSYTYNADGIRTSKTVNGVTREYVLNGTQILGEKWSDGTIIVYIYDAEGAAIGMLYRESDYAQNVFDAYFYERNLQGDIIAVYDCEGTKLVSYVYDAWGNVTTTYSNGGASTGAQYNPFTYRGYYRDSETGFYYLNSRYYDPIIGRFISADGLLAGNAGDLEGYNLFAYCFNDPINLTDGEGNWPKWLKKVVTAVVIVVAVAAVAAVVVTGVGAVVGATISATAGAAIQATATATFVGGVVSGGFNVANQIQEKGAENIDMSEVAVSTAAGSARATIDKIGISNVVGKTLEALIKVSASSAVSGAENVIQAGLKNDKTNDWSYILIRGLRIL